MSDHHKDPDVLEQEHANSSPTTSEKPNHEDDVLHGFQTDETSLPKGYYRSPFFRNYVRDRAWAFSGSWRLCTRCP